MNNWSVVLVACVTAFSAITVALIQRGRNENIRDHNKVIERLDSIDNKLSGHLRWHKSKAVKK